MRAALQNNGDHENYGGEARAETRFQGTSPLAQASVDPNNGNTLRLMVHAQVVIMRLSGRPRGKTEQDKGLSALGYFGNSFKSNVAIFEKRRPRRGEILNRNDDRKQEEKDQQHRWGK